MGFLVWVLGFGCEALTTARSRRAQPKCEKLEISCLSPRAFSQRKETKHAIYGCEDPFMDDNLYLGMSSETSLSTSPLKKPTRAPAPMQQICKATFNATIRNRRAPPRARNKICKSTFGRVCPRNTCKGKGDVRLSGGSSPASLLRSCGGGGGRSSRRRSTS